MKKKELFEEIIKEQNKYSDLLWYARSAPEHDNIPGVKENRERIEESYPDEVNALYEDDSNWQHGFHSGMVAALRYILTMDDDGIEQAKEEFPMLDS